MCVCECMCVCVSVCVYLSVCWGWQDQQATASKDTLIMKRATPLRMFTKWTGVVDTSGKHTSSALSTELNDYRLSVSLSLCVCVCPSVQSWSADFLSVRARMQVCVCICLRVCVCLCVCVLWLNVDGSVCVGMCV